MKAVTLRTTASLLRAVMKQIEKRLVEAEGRPVHGHLLSQAKRLLQVQDGGLANRIEEADSRNGPSPMSRTDVPSRPLEHRSPSGRGALSRRIRLPDGGALCHRPEG